MSKETNGEEKISPAEKARRLGLKAKEQREQEERDLQMQKTEKYSDLQERMKAESEAIAGNRRELGEVQEGLDEISDIESKGLMSDDLKELRAELEMSKSALENKIKDGETALQALEADPLRVEMAAVEAAAKKEEARVQAEEKGALQQKEAREKLEQGMRTLDAFIDEIDSAINVAKTREATIISLREQKKELEKAKEKLAKSIETDIGGFLYVLPEKQQRAIAAAVAEARQNNVTIYGSDVGSGEGRIVYRPGATTMSEWYSAWREKVVPSFVPFFDKELRALLAFEGEPRLEQFQKIVAEQENLYEKEKALFEDRKKTNTEFMERFLAADSPSKSIDYNLLQGLRSDEGVDGNMMDEKLRVLANLRKEFNFLAYDIGDDLYRKFEQRNFISATTIENIAQR